MEEFEKFIPEESREEFQSALNSYAEKQKESWTNEYSPVLEKKISEEYKGRASKDADAILDNVFKGFVDDYGFQNREKGTHATEWFKEQSANYLSRIKDDASIQESEFEKKFKESQQKLAEYADYDDLKNIASEYEKVKEENYKHFTEKSFNKYFPKFDENINEYELDTKVSRFKAEVLDKYTFTEENGEVVLIDKENEFSKKKLEELVTSSSEINSLKKNEPKGIGSGQTKTVDVEGVKLSIKKGAEIKDIVTEVNKYLDTKDYDWLKREEEFERIFEEAKKKYS